MTNVQAFALDLLADARAELRAATRDAMRADRPADAIARACRASRAVRDAREQCQRLGAFAAEDAYIPPVLDASRAGSVTVLRNTVT